METRCLSTPADWSHVPTVKGVGALVIVGGGGTPPVVHDVFFHLAGGPDAVVLHMPSATRTFEEITDRRDYYSAFYNRNPRSFDFLHTYDPVVARSKEFAAPLEQATGVWIGGGTQSRLSDLFLNTEVHAGLHRLLQRGGVIGGTSSGTAILSDAMICCGYEEIEFGQGFSLYPRAIVDPHFRGRQREKRVARAVLLRPDQIAVAIDERTALVVQGRYLSVIGAGDGAAWFHFADPVLGRVHRYRLNIGETTQLPVPVLGADPVVLQNHLRGLGQADVITADELVPEPEEVA